MSYNNNRKNPLRSDTSATPSTTANDENRSVICKNNEPRPVDYGSISSTGAMRDCPPAAAAAAPVPEAQPPNGGSGRHRVRFINDNHDTGVQWLLDRLDSAWPATAGSAVAVLLAVLIAWCLFRVNVTPALMAVPGGSVASLFILYGVSMAAARAVGTVEGLPPLLGMMVAGIALQNCGLYTVTADWCVELVSILRETALSVILIKGGLELNAGQLRRLSSAVARLALLPCIAEAVAVAVAARLVLNNYSWYWSLVLGFTLSAVSPAVLVPNLLLLKRMGYGEGNGVNTMVIAASSLDDIVAISAFGVFLGMIFSTGDMTSKIIQGPVDICIGTALGLVWGFLLIFVPPPPWAKVYRGMQGNENQNDGKQINNSVVNQRAFLLGAGGFLAVTGSKLYGYPGAGPLACIISSFVAGTGWKWRVKTHDCINPTVISFNCNDTEDQEDPVEKTFEFIWFCLQPFLFASIGTEVKFELLKSDGIIVSGIVILVFGLIVRLIVTSCSVWGTGFNKKEVAFINIAWLPKATVQATLAPVALDMARNLGSLEDIQSASVLLTIAVLSILITAPIGAFGIQWFGPKLLSNR